MAHHPKRKPLSQEPQKASIEALTHEGRGIAHVAGKTIFIDGALPGETVWFHYLRRRGKFDEGRVLEVLQPAPSRVEPRCRHFGVCGGCSLQHLSTVAQLQLKQVTVREQFRHFGGVEPEQWLPPLAGAVWGYRYKARLGVKFVKKKDRVLVGFREKGSSLIAALERCEVLHPPVGSLLPALGELIASLSCYDRIPQIEVAAGDQSTGLVFRHLVPLTTADTEQLMAFGQAHKLQIYLQGGGAETVRLLWPAEARLSYSQFGELEMIFLPTDFTQVNREVNTKMVQQVLALLEIASGERVLDLFCGVGNFTLPLAMAGAEVVGIEGDAGLVARARANAAHNRLENVRFDVADLNGLEWTHHAWAREGFSKALLDPPRSGALLAVQQMSKLRVQRIVYISCNPATLARDAGELVNRQGYRLRYAGVIDMFPHTTHVETLALFERLRKH
ncbi:23S rRNA (uracil(1939)-C(5))-methyltransferase RlmD [Nitrosococcus watsonii]|uniref:23S rRNA (uracil(1939)-C(5))-methyltransferase RlmD n=1 Tax=Nitrosococcus watsoni (strain C-113) TaxID=105559 RepID=D8K8L7_NITWC|nr:23S rRNA (uracil(1939)-C(5))-methyltransferase RlmD [Nitrosococcus watsonii]ADJ29137.1 RNA methyltransferase, TrmA family [Nitrosococcus watsonii C-113]